MKEVLLIVEAVIGSLMCLLILLQHRASGLSAAFGGTGSTYVQRRGAERALYVLTVWLSVAFIGVAIVLMYL